jgi:dihydroflavonol-4-reductase
MADDIATATVLVTGGSGYLGGWIAVGLLRLGYNVRVTIRNLARQDEVRAMIASEVDPGDRLTFVAADLLKDEGWDLAVKGATFVMHVASPMPVGEFRNQDIITPAREGTRRVLEAAAKAGVKRVVLTSSAAAAAKKNKLTQTVNETIWTNLPDKRIYSYPRAKTLAEQDAWAFVRKTRGMELVSILPSQIQGPVLGNDYSASVGVIAMMLSGKMPVIPQVGFGIVDVRDLVDINIKAMTMPEAAGERFLATSDFLWFADMARILRERLGDRAAKVPTRMLPNWVARFGALFNAEMAQMAPTLNVRTTGTSVKAQRLLGWQPRPAADSIVDAANSLIDHGLGSE